MRKCASCNEVKPLEHFYKDRNRPLGRSYRCKTCGKAHSNKMKRKTNYGLSDETFKALKISQQNLCAICGSDSTGIERTTEFSVDHCHKTGKVRGLLCNWCNQGLGHFRDSIEILNKAINYLQKE